ncbi:MAG: hypothetical protein RL199_2091 [Pseudomonadota bacterium]|jgi:hypothetical protein
MTWQFGWAVVLLVAAAEVGRPLRNAGTSRRTVIRFDGDDIDGSLTRPEGDLVAGRRQSRRPPLASPPADFEDAARRDLLDAAGRLRRP